MLSIMEIKWGLVPDVGITQTFPRLLPIDVAKELTFTGRVVSGSEGFEFGLVTRTSEDPLSAALALLWLEYPERSRFSSTMLRTNRRDHTTRLIRSVGRHRD